ncbi:MAG: hypothetical protein HY235_29055 [Acidobacteria bacterium]|nr:hypothetical protein [Acidobacteriota bacterium]
MFWQMMAVAVCFLPCAMAQELARPSLGTREVERLAALAAQMPAELGADVLLRLADSPGLPTRQQKALIEQALAFSSSAVYPVRITLTPSVNERSDSDIGILHIALKDGIDALSLKSRAVRQLLRISPKSAWEAFDSISPQFPTASCVEAYGYDAGYYWQTIRALYEGMPMRQARDRESATLFIEGALRRTSSGPELAAAAFSLADIKAGSEEMRRFLLAYSSAMNAVQLDARSLEHFSTPGLFGALKTLVAKGHDNSATGIILVRAIRSFLARHLSRPLCAEARRDLAEAAAGREARNLARFVVAFNETFASDVDETRAKLDVGRVGEAINPGAGRVVEFWTTPGLAALMRQVRVLRYGTASQQKEYLPTRKYLPLEERTAATWQRDLTDLLKQLDSSRREEGVSEKAQFHQMALVYTALLATVPPGEQRWAILARFATFLRGSSIRSESPPEWRQHVLELVRHSRESVENGTELIAELRRLGDPSISVLLDLP